MQNNYRRNPVFFELKIYKRVMSGLTTSKKVELSLKEQGRNKSWLALQLGISRPVLYQRLNDNLWKIGEISKLNTIGLI